MYFKNLSNMSGVLKVVNDYSDVSGSLQLRGGDKIVNFRKQKRKVQLSKFKGEGYKRETIIVS